MLGELMEAVNDEMGDRDNLAEAISAVLEVSTDEVRLIPHAYDKDFTISEMTVEHAEEYLCERIPPLPVRRFPNRPTTASTGPLSSDSSSKGIREGFWDYLGPRRTADGRSFPPRPSSNSQKCQAKAREWAATRENPMSQMRRPGLAGIMLPSLSGSRQFT